MNILAIIKALMTFDFASGYRTYVIGGILVAIGVAEGVFMIDIPYVVVGDDWVLWVLNGLGINGLRAGVAKMA